MSTFRSCLRPPGLFTYGIHKPSYTVTNLRENTRLATLGSLAVGGDVTNQANYPEDDVQVDNADWIFEIPNPFPFKGATYIDKEWADTSAANPDRISIEQPEPVSMSKILAEHGAARTLFAALPSPVLLSLATCSTDPDDLVRLAEISCEIEKDTDGVPTGLVYQKNSTGRTRSIIHDHPLFEAVANNPYLPESYRIAMVIRPGAQGGSEIVGEWPLDDHTHIYEYLRRNSYIAGGHYAANMADDAIRYSIGELHDRDMTGLRHLYYQRTYIRLAAELGIESPATRRLLTPNELEELRLAIQERLVGTPKSVGTTLWGWNFGFDYAPSRYRLHASHQQIHQQYAMIPDEVKGYQGNLHDSTFSLKSFGCGDLIAEVIQGYGEAYNRDYFTDYLTALENNSRMDGREDLESSLIVWQDDNAVLFVPKAQTSQWELQLMTISREGPLAGNVVEAEPAVRHSLDTGILTAQKGLAGLGAKMVTSIEYPKRIGAAGQAGQPLLYCFLPRLPESPGAFSEAQLRFINGHYPEDFAARLRKKLAAAH